MNTKKLLTIAIVCAISTASYAAPPADTNGAINSNDGGDVNSEQKGENRNDRNDRDSLPRNVANAITSAITPADVTRLIAANPSLAALITSAAIKANPALAAEITSAAIAAAPPADAAAITNAAVKASTDAANKAGTDPVAAVAAVTRAAINAAPLSSASAIRDAAQAAAPFASQAITDAVSLAVYDNLTADITEIVPTDDIPATVNIFGQAKANVDSAFQQGLITDAQRVQLDTQIDTSQRAGGLPTSISPNS